MGKRLPFEFEPDVDEPDWSRADKVHDWRNHVGKHSRLIWPSLTPAQRTALALDAQELATMEWWE